MGQHATNANVLGRYTIPSTAGKHKCDEGRSSDACVKPSDRHSRAKHVTMNKTLLLLRREPKKVGSNYSNRPSHPIPPGFGTGYPDCTVYLELVRVHAKHVIPAQSWVLSNTWQHSQKVHPVLDGPCTGEPRTVVPGQVPGLPTGVMIAAFYPAPTTLLTLCHVHPLPSTLLHAPISFTAKVYFRHVQGTTPPTCDANRRTRLTVVAPRVAPAAVMVYCHGVNSNTTAEAAKVASTVLDIADWAAAEYAQAGSVKVACVFMDRSGCGLSGNLLEQGYISASYVEEATDTIMSSALAVSIAQHLCSDDGLGCVQGCLPGVSCPAHMPDAVGLQGAGAAHHVVGAMWLVPGKSMRASSRSFARSSVHDVNPMRCAANFPPGMPLIIVEGKRDRVMGNPLTTSSNYHAAAIAGNTEECTPVEVLALQTPCPVYTTLAGTHHLTASSQCNHDQGMLLPKKHIVPFLKYVWPRLCATVPYNCGQGNRNLFDTGKNHLRSYIIELEELLSPSGSCQRVLEAVIAELQPVDLLGKSFHQHGLAPPQQMDWVEAEYKTSSARWPPVVATTVQRLLDSYRAFSKLYHGKNPWQDAPAKLSKAGISVLDSLITSVETERRALCAAVGDKAYALTTFHHLHLVRMEISKCIKEYSVILSSAPGWIPTSTNAALFKPAKQAVQAIETVIKLLPAGREGWEQGKGGEPPPQAHRAVEAAKMTVSICRKIFHGSPTSSPGSLTASPGTNGPAVQGKSNKLATSGTAVAVASHAHLSKLLLLVENVHGALESAKEHVMANMMRKRLTDYVPQSVLRNCGVRPKDYLFRLKQRPLSPQAKAAPPKLPAGSKPVLLRTGRVPEPMLTPDENRGKRLADKYSILSPVHHPSGTPLPDKQHIRPTILSQSIKQEPSGESSFDATSPTQSQRSTSEPNLSSKLERMGPIISGSFSPSRHAVDGVQSPGSTVSTALESDGSFCLLPMGDPTPMPASPTAESLPSPEPFPLPSPFQLLASDERVDSPTAPTLQRSQASFYGCFPPDPCVFTSSCRDFEQLKMLYNERGQESPSSTPSSSWLPSDEQETALSLPSEGQSSSLPPSLVLPPATLPPSTSATTCHPLLPDTLPRGTSAFCRGLPETSIGATQGSLCSDQTFCQTYSLECAQVRQAVLRTKVQTLSALQETTLSKSVWAKTRVPIMTIKQSKQGSGGVAKTSSEDLSLQAQARTPPALQCTTSWSTMSSQ
eukprot:gene6059-1084_t